MAKKRFIRGDISIADQLLHTADATIVDLLDHVLNKGVMATGDVTLGVASVDLIYLRLSALLCAADRVFATSDRSIGKRIRAARKRR